MMNKLIMTIGLPRSGKSTWALQQNTPIVNPDAIRLALHGQPFIGLAEGFVWAIAKVMVRALFITGHDTVILDATNTTEKRREEWKSKSWEQVFVVFSTTAEVCIQRAKDTDKEYLVPVIEKMAEELELPDEYHEPDEDCYINCTKCGAIVTSVAPNLPGTEYCKKCDKEFYHRGK